MRKLLIASAFAIAASLSFGVGAQAASLTIHTGPGPVVHYRHHHRHHRHWARWHRRHHHCYTKTVVIKHHGHRTVRRTRVCD